MKTRAAPGIIIIISITIITIITIITTITIITIIAITVITVIIKTVKPGGAAGISGRGAVKGRRGSQRRTEEGLIIKARLETMNTRSCQESSGQLHSF